MIFQKCIHYARSHHIVLSILCLSVIVNILFLIHLFHQSRTVSILSRVDISHLQSPTITLVVVSDSNFEEKYRTQSRSIQCYAESHNYEFLRLDPAIVAPICVEQHSEFFFRKHCAVAQWLRSRAPDSVVAVLDGDVVAGTSKHSLDKWIGYDFDISFYERSWNFEIMSGNYIARNTRFTRAFLQHWASYEYIKPTGFSSADNGAIHLAVLEALGIRGRANCRDLYRALVDPVTNLGPYFKFVACVKALLGPPRTHVARDASHLDILNGTKQLNETSEEKIAGKLVIFPRLFGFVVDSKVHGYTSFRNLHPFHHGIKNEDWKDEYLDAGVRGGKACKPFSTNGTVSRKDMAEHLRRSDFYFLNSTDGDTAVVPRWGHVDMTCHERLWCGPLEEKPEKWPTGFVADGGILKEITYEDPGVDWHFDFIASVKG